jgi:hypothetical protein
MGTNIKINHDAFSNTQFAQLMIGDWFYSEGTVYIKIKDDRSGHHYAIDIEDGLIQSFEPNEEVVFLRKVEINI